jgi:hypothetical protein
MAIDGLSLDLTVLCTKPAMGHAMMATVLLQSILLLGDILSFLLDLLDVGISGILLQCENLFLEHLDLLPSQSANGFVESHPMRCWLRRFTSLGHARDGREDVGGMRPSGPEARTNVGDD